MKSDVVKLSGLDSRITLPWILDEFDDSFNELAQATLRYHLHHSIATPSQELAETYRKLIEDFNPEMLTEQDLQHLESCVLEDCENCHELSQHYEKEQVRITQVRKRFVDVMPTLWS